MRKLVAAAGCVFGFLLAGTAWAGAEPEAVIDSFLKGLVAGEASAAFDTLMTRARIDELKPKQMPIVKGQLHKGLSLYGAPNGYEKLAQKPYGSSVLRLIYLTKHTDIALVWNFYFYRATTDWQLLNFDFNDQFQKLE